MIYGEGVSSIVAGRRRKVESKLILEKSSSGTSALEGIAKAGSPQGCWRPSLLPRPL